MFTNQVALITDLVPSRDPKGLRSEDRDNLNCLGLATLASWMCVDDERHLREKQHARSNCIQQLTSDRTIRRLRGNMKPSEIVEVVATFEIL
jgi:hypothetical protein